METPHAPPPWPSAQAPPRAVCWALSCIPCTHVCTPVPSNTIIKFTDATTDISLISRGYETAYRDEVNRLAGRCSKRNLLLNTSKTKEMVIDLRIHKGEPAPLSITGDCVQQRPVLRSKINLSWISFSNPASPNLTTAVPHNLYYDAGYQLVQSTQGFPIQRHARSHKRGGVCAPQPIANIYQSRMLYKKSKL